MNPTTTAWAVEARGLTKNFGDHRALDDVDLKIETGIVYGLLGPNGAGKTTCLRILNTLLRADGGTATLFGHDVGTEPHVVRQLIGVTGQYASVDENLSAERNLYLFSRLNGLSRSASRARAERLLEEFELTQAVQRPLKRFSGGMRRRLDLAASLISSPPLLFLDEPTTGLDPRTRLKLWETIRRLVESGGTVVLTTQYLDEADQLADRIGVIDRGRLVAEGTPDALKATVGSNSLQLSLVHAADAEQTGRIVATLLGSEPVWNDVHDKLTAPRATPEAVTELLVELRRQRIEVVGLAVQKPTLDEVFLTLTGRASTPATETDPSLDRSAA